MPISTGMRDVREPLSAFAYEMKRPHPTLAIQTQVRRCARVIVGCSILCFLGTHCLAACSCCVPCRREHGEAGVRGCTTPLPPSLPLSLPSCPPLPPMNGPPVCALHRVHVDAIRCRAVRGDGCAVAYMGFLCQAPKTAWDLKVSGAEKVYGSALAMSMSMDRALLAQFQRGPGLESSFSGLDTFLGRDDKLGFEDILGCTSPRLRVPCRVDARLCSHRAVCVR
jgi:hypothetical protein